MTKIKISLYFEFMQRFWLGFLLSSLIGALYFIYMFYSEEGYLPMITTNFPEFILSIITANICGFAIYWSDRQLNRFLPWKERLTTRLTLGMFKNILLGGAIVFSIGWLFLGYRLDNFNIDFLFTSYYDGTIKLFIILLMTIVLYSLIYFALYSYHEYAIVHIEEIKNQRRQLQLQYEALKSQLSPHYLFNSLNTVSSLVFKSPKLAEDFIRRLAQTYQYILDNHERRFVYLEEELEFVRSYNYLLKVRFENNLTLQIDLPPHLMKTSIPPLTLQMLVENAVKHNVITRDQPLNIYINAPDNQSIEVSNTKTVAPSQTSSFHVGLENIRQRYGFFTDRSIEIEDSNYFTVKLPVLLNDLVKTA